MLGARSGLAIALVLCAGAIALFSTCPERQAKESVQQPRRSEPALPEEPGALEGPAELEAREAVTAPLHAVAEASAKVDPEARPEERYGSIYGTVYDPRGGALARRAVRFTREDGYSRTVWSDKGGAYEIEAVPVGSFDAYYVGKTYGGNGSGVLFGKLDVLQNQAAIFDFVLIDERVLSGHLTVPETDGVLLRLELRSAWDDERILADGVAISRVVEQEPPDENPAMWPLEQEAQASGLFRMEGLSADRYVLRIIVGTDTEGHSIYIEREIDLTTGDVTLDEAFTYQDFVDASVQRWMSADPR